MPCLGGLSGERAETTLRAEGQHRRETGNEQESTRPLENAQEGGCVERRRKMRRGTKGWEVEMTDAALSAPKAINRPLKRQFHRFGSAN